MPEDERRYPDADPSLAYDLAKNEVSVLLASVDALNDRIAVGASLGTTLVAILLALLGIQAGQDTYEFSRWSVGLAAATGGLFLLSLSSFATAFRGYAWEIGLPPQQAWNQAERYRDYPQVLYWWATEMFLEALSHNQKQYERKQLWTTLGFALLGLQLATGVAATTMTFNQAERDATGVAATTMTFNQV